MCSERYILFCMNKCSDVPQVTSNCDMKFCHSIVTQFLMAMPMHWYVSALL